MRQEEILDLIFDLAPPQHHEGTTVAPLGHCQGTTDTGKQLSHIPTYSRHWHQLNHMYIVSTKKIVLAKVSFLDVAEERFRC